MFISKTLNLGIRPWSRLIQNPAYKAVIFDMGGVYLRFNHPVQIQHERTAGSEKFFDLLHEYESGQTTSVQLVHFIQECKPEFKDLEPSKTVQYFLGDKDPIVVKAVQILKENKIKVALLTNIGWQDESRTKTDIPDDVDQFDVVVESCAYGIRKPDERIYNITSKQLGISNSECIFVDDLERNCTAAEAVGMSAVRVVSGDTSTAMNKIGDMLGIKLVE